MNYTGYISMVKTNISGCCHFEFKIAQTSVFLNFLKTVKNGNWSLKAHKNQCFMNDQLLCGKWEPNIHCGHRMNYTGLISMVLKPASQVAAILNSKLHKHQYF